MILFRYSSICRSFIASIDRFSESWKTIVVCASYSRAAPRRLRRALRHRLVLLLPV
jgi:hypothetical protein